MVRPRLLAVVLLALGLSVSGCTSGGSALRDVGRSTRFGLLDVRAGDVVWLTLPTFDDDTDQPVKMLTAHLIDVPSSVTVLRYRGQSTQAHRGVLMGFRRGDSAGQDPMRYPDVSITSMVAPAHGRADGYVMVELKLLKPVRVELRKTAVTYRWQGQEYTQTLSMDLVIDGDPKAQALLDTDGSSPPG